MATRILFYESVDTRLNCLRRILVLVYDLFEILLAEIVPGALHWPIATITGRHSLQRSFKNFETLTEGWRCAMFRRPHASQKGTRNTTMARESTSSKPFNPEVFTFSCGCRTLRGSGAKDNL